MCSPLLFGTCPPGLHPASCGIAVFAPRRLPVKVSGRKKVRWQLQQTNFFIAHLAHLFVLFFELDSAFFYSFSLVAEVKKWQTQREIRSNRKWCAAKKGKKCYIFLAKNENLFYFHLMIYSIVKCARLCSELTLKGNRASFCICRV